MTKSCPAYATLEQGCVAFPGEPASSAVLWNSLLLGGTCLYCKVGDVKVLGTPWLWHWSGCTKVRRQLNRQADRHPWRAIHRKRRTGSKSVKPYLCFPAREGCLWYTRVRRVVLVQWVHPSAVEGRAAVQGCLCVCCIFLALHSPSSTLFGNPDVLIQCRNASANPFLPPWQREFLNHTDAHGLVGAVLWCQSGVTLRSWSWLSSESIPGCQVFVSQRGNASFQLVSFNHEVWGRMCLWKYLVTQHGKAAVVEGAVLFNQMK